MNLDNETGVSLDASADAKIETTGPGNRRTLWIRPPMMVGTPTAAGSERRRGSNKSIPNKEDKDSMTSGTTSSPIPPSSFESMEYLAASRLKKDPTYPRGWYVPPYRQASTETPSDCSERPRDEHLVQDGDINTVSLDEWITMKKLSLYRGSLKGYVSNISELMELEPIKIEEMTRHCGMGWAFTQRLKMAHSRLIEPRSTPTGSSAMITATHLSAPTRETVAWNDPYDYDRSGSRSSSPDPYNPPQDPERYEE